MEIIELILAVVGLISLAVTVFRIIWVIRSPRNEWRDNVTITDVAGGELCLDDCAKVFVDSDAPDFCRSVVEIKPRGCIIRKIRIKKLVPESINRRKLKYKTVEKVLSVTPDFPLYMAVERGEAIARFMIEWRSDYGEKGEYYFYENLRNGDNDRDGICYSSGLFCKIRKLLGFR